MKKRSCPSCGYNSALAMDPSAEEGDLIVCRCGTLLEWGSDGVVELSEERFNCMQENVQELLRQQQETNRQKFGDRPNDPFSEIDETEAPVEFVPSND